MVEKKPFLGSLLVFLSLINHHFPDPKHLKNDPDEHHEEERLVSKAKKIVERADYPASCWCKIVCQVLPEVNRKPKQSQKSNEESHALHFVFSVFVKENDKRSCVNGKLAGTHTQEHDV